MNTRQHWERLRESGHRLVPAALVGLIALMHIPAMHEALNYFDSPKRLLWSGVAVMLSAGTLLSCRRERIALSLGALGCMSWMLLRSLLRAGPVIGGDELANWLLPGVLFGAGLTLDQERHLKPIAWALVVAGFIQAALMIAQYAGVDPLFGSTTVGMDYRPGRMIGTIGYHNQAADFLAVCSVGLFLLVHRPWLRMLLVGGVLLVVGLTASRAGIVGIAGALGASEVVRIFRENRRRVAVTHLLAPAAALAILAGGLVLFMPTTRDRFADVIWHPERVAAVSSRVTMAKVALTMVAEKPILGWGAGSFAFQYLDRLGDLLPDEKTHADIRHLVYARETHNDYLQFVAEFGLPGLAGLLGLVMVAGGALVRESRRDSSCRDACMFLFCYLLISGLFSFPWQTAMAGPLAGLLFGVLLPATAPAAAPPLPRRSWRRIGVRLVFLFLSICLLAWFGIETRLNVTVPRMISENRATELADRIPAGMHRFHAIAGAGLAQDGNDQEALPILRHALTGYRDILLYNNLGNVLSKLGRWDEAVTVYHDWAATGLDHSTALKNLSIAYEQVGDYRNAALVMRRQMHLWRDEHHIAAVERLITLYLRAGMPADAMRVLHWFETSVLKNPEDYPATFDNLAGAVLLATGDRTGAERRFRQALRKQPTLQSARRNLEALRRTQTVGNAVVL